jgi:hypothetical protein
MGRLGQAGQVPVALNWGRVLSRPLQRGAGNPLSGVVGEAAGFYSGAMADEDTPSEAGTETRPADEYDIPWKEAIEGAFPEFMAFYFRAAHDAIDWAKGHEFLDKELHQVVRDAASGHKFVDLLVRVMGRDSAERLLYVHVEVQTQRDEAFASRMFTYHHRLIDRWGQSVASFAVLADDSPGWRPSQYRIDVLGCTHVFNFPTAKLLDFEPELAALKRQSNPFALVTAAHLSALRTRRNVGRRFAAKRELVRLLYEQGWERQRVIDLFAIIDWMLALPKEMEQKVWQDIDEIERKAQMKYVTSVERLAIERGREKWMAEGETKGKLETLTRLLTRRFGPLPEWAAHRLSAGTVEQLDTWFDRGVDAINVAEVFGGH